MKKNFLTIYDNSKTACNCHNILSVLTAFEYIHDYNYLEIIHLPHFKLGFADEEGLDTGEFPILEVIKRNISLGIRKFLTAVSKRHLFLCHWCQFGVKLL